MFQSQQCGTQVVLIDSIISLVSAGEFLTFIVLNLGCDWLGRSSMTNFIYSFHTELVLLVLGQVLKGSRALGEDLAVGHIELCAVRPHLLHIVAGDGAAAVGARRLPGQRDGGSSSVSVVQLLRSRWRTWTYQQRSSADATQPADSKALLLL